MVGGPRGYQSSSGQPVQFIVPYALPVVVFTWKYGLRPGLIVASGSVLAAAVGGALPSNAHVSLVEDGLYAYAKLSAVAMGVSLALYTGRRHLRSGSE